MAPLVLLFLLVPLSSGTEASLRGVAAVSASTAWATGTQGTALLTTDGGATWNRRPVPGAEALDFRDVAAFPGGKAILLSAGEGEKSRIYRTTDAGATWKLLFTNPDPKGFWDAIAFWDERHGILLGDPVDGRFVIYTTSDGGDHWERHNTPPALAEEGAFAASGTCLIAGSGRRAWFGTGGGRVFATRDGGESWEVAETPIRHEGPAAGIFSIAMAPNGHGIAVGGDYRKPEEGERAAVVTTDFGRTWKLAGAPRGYRSAVLYSGRQWLAGGTSGVDASADGGRSWQPVEGAGYNALAVTGAGAGFAVGPQGRIARIGRR